LKVNVFKTIGLVLPVLVMILFGYFLLSNNFKAGLGMIDDHEIAMFLGSDGKICVSEIPSLLFSTEVGQFGKALRYRPSYYFLRILESLLWQDKAILWYGFRYLMLVLSLVLGFKLMSSFYPKIISYLFIFYSLTMPFWPDLLTRLGPSEIYTVPGLMLFLFGFSKKNQFWLTFGYLVCVGSKENFLFLFPIVLGLFIYKVIKKQVNKVELLSYLLMIGYTLFIGLAITLATKNSGADVYGTAISYPDRILGFIKMLPAIIRTRHAELAMLTLVGSFGYLAFKVKTDGFKKTIKLKLFKYLGVMMIIGLVIASQYILYNNSLPTNMRYDFPGIILFRVLDLVAIALILESLKKVKRFKLIKFGGYLMMAVFMVYYILTRRYTLILMASEKNARLSNEFSQKIELVAKTLKNSPEIPLVFVSRHYIDFEPIVSVTRYLTAKGVNNEFKLNFKEQKIDKTDSLGQELNDRLVKVSLGEEKQDELFKRFTSFDEEVPCYSISFQREYPGPCELITRF